MALAAILTNSFPTVYRRALTIVTYLLFPINVLVGVLAGVWRVVVSAFYNVAHFCRLDVSLLSHGVEAFDPGKPAPANRPTSPTFFIFAMLFMFFSELHASFSYWMHIPNSNRVGMTVALPFSPMFCTDETTLLKKTLNRNLVGSWLEK